MTAPLIRLRVNPSLLPQEVEFQQDGADLQYRYVGTSTWTTLGQFGATVTIGTVSTLAPDASATVVNVGTDQNVILDIGIPAGSDGLVQTIVEGDAVTIDSSDPNNPVVGLDAAAAVRDYLDAPVYVTSLTDLKALDTTRDTRAIHDGSLWIFKSGNYATLVTADTVGALYAKADAIATTVGAWVRQFSGPALALWWGLVPNAGTDQSTAVAAMLTYAQTAPVYLPSGVYLGSPGTYTGCQLRGDGPYSSQLKLKSGSSGVFVTINNATKIDINGVGFDGDKTNNASGTSCLRIQGTEVSSDHIIRNCGFFSGNTDGLAQAGTYTGISIIDCVATGNTNDGISISTATDGLLRGNKVQSNGRFGIIVTGARNRILGNFASSNTSTGIAVSATSFPVIVGNESVSNTGHGIQMGTVTDGLMSGNAGHSNGISGLDSYACTRSTITGNVANSNTIRGIEVDSASDNNLISGNNCNGNGDVDISVFRSQDTQLVGNNGNVRIWDSSTVASAAVSAGGSGYAVGNVLTVVGGTKLTAATLTVATLSGSAVATVTVSNAGDYWTFPTDPVSVTGGAGTGATFNLTKTGANSGTCSGISIIGGGTDKALTIISGSASAVNLSQWRGTVSDTGLHIVGADGCPSYTVPLTLITLQNSWVAYDVNWQAPAYRKDSDGVVRLFGVMKSGTTTATTVVGNLPAGYRPSKVEGPFAVAMNGGIGQIYVSSNGDIVAQSTLNATYTALDGISFKIA